jgi:hypothetical protein
VSVEAGCNLRRRGARLRKRPKTATAPTAYGLRDDGTDWTGRYTVPVRGVICEKRVRKHSICRHRTRKKRLWKPLDRTATTKHTASARKSNRYTLLLLGGGGNNEPAGSMHDICATLHMLVLLGGSIALSLISDVIWICRFDLQPTPWMVWC